VTGLGRRVAVSVVNLKRGDGGELREMMMRRVEGRRKGKEGVGGAGERTERRREKTGSYSATRSVVREMKQERWLSERRKSSRSGVVNSIQNSNTTLYSPTLFNSY
jgi:hypothetical protein